MKNFSAYEERSSPAGWSIRDIPYRHIDRGSVHEREDLFFLIVSSSFVEIASDLYASNLVDYYAGDEDTSGWLANHWEHEEVQHGHALKAYANHVWPEFDWDTAYANFFEEYSRICTVDEFEGTRALEMAARCVVEMGTATMYRALRDCTDEPVLKLLANYIRSDEVRHYKHFYRYFLKYNAIERNGRWKVLGALWRRLLEIRQSDGDCALRHVFAMRYPGVPTDGKLYRQAFGSVTKLIRSHFPTEMAVRMILKPLDIPPAIRGFDRAIARAAQHLILR